MDDLKDLLFSDNANKIRGKWTKDADKAKRFSEAIKMIDSLCSETEIFAYQADDVNQPLYVHSIRIRWLTGEVDCLEGKRLGELISKCQFFSTYKLTISGELDEWILSSEIYTEAP